MIKNYRWWEGLHSRSYRRRYNLNETACYELQTTILHDLFILLCSCMKPRLDINRGMCILNLLVVLLHTKDLKNIKRCRDDMPKSMQTRYKNDIILKVNLQSLIPESFSHVH